MIRLTSIVLALAALAATSFGFALDWQVLTSAEGKFSVSFPGKAQYFNQETEAADGSKLEIHLFGLEHEGLAFLVSYNDYGFSAMSLSHADQVLNGVVGGVAGSMKATVEKSEKLMLGKIPGRTATLKTESGSARLHAFFSGKRLYQLLVIIPSGKDGSSDIEKFLGSFKIAS